MTYLVSGSWVQKETHKALLSETLCKHKIHLIAFKLCICLWGHTQLLMQGQSSLISTSQYKGSFIKHGENEKCKQFEWQKSIMRIFMENFFLLFLPLFINNEAFNHCLCQQDRWDQLIYEKSRVWSTLLKRIIHSIIMARGRQPFWWGKASLFV